VLVRLPAAQLAEHEPVLAAALAPDGNAVALALPQGTLRLVDVLSGKMLHSYKGVSEGKSALHFSPDGRYIALIRKPGHVALWDVVTGKQALQLKPAQGQFTSFTFSADGKTLAAVAEREEQGPLLYVWDVTTGQERSRFPPLQNWQIQAALSADGKLIASWGQEVRLGERARNQLRRRTIQVRDVATGKELRSIQVKEVPSGGAVFSPDGRVLATSDGNGMIQLWNVITGDEVLHVAGPEELGPVFRFSPDGKLLFAGSTDGVIYAWDAVTGKSLGRHRLPEGQFYSLVFLGGQQMRVMGIQSEQSQSYRPERQTIWIWESTAGARTILDGHHGAVRAAAFLPTGNLATAGADGKLCIWDAATGKLLLQVSLIEDRQQSRFEQGGSVSFSSDGQYVAVGVFLEGIRLCDAATGHKIREFGRDSMEVGQLIFSPDGSLLAGGRGNRISVWEVASGRELRRLSRRQRGVINGMRPDTPFAFSSDNTVLVAEVEEKDRFGTGLETIAEIAVYDPQRDKYIATLKTVKDADESRDRFLVASPGAGALAEFAGRTTTVGDVTTGRQLRRAEQKITLCCQPVFAPDGRTIALAGVLPDRKEVAVHSLEVASGKLRRVLHSFAPTQMVSCMAFSPDGKRLATGLLDGSVLTWNLAEPPSAESPPKLSLADLERLWADLAVEDGAIGYRAIQRLKTSPVETVALFRRKLPPVGLKDSEIKEIGRLLALLDHDEFEQREHANQELRRFGEKSRPALVKALANKPPPEVQRRVEQLLEQLDVPEPPAEMVRPLRVLELLEHIGTPEARPVLETLAQGKPDSHITREARAVLRRLKKLAKK
jgi:WD40 repeat protein